MTGIVWYNDFENGQRKMTEIKNDYYIKNIHMTHEKISIEFKCATTYFDNGDIWYLKNANSYSLGCRSNISYIESTISESVVKHIIKPCACSTPFVHYQEYIY